jgi:hypothetical protein
MKDTSNSANSGPGDCTQSEHRAVFEAWLQKDREQEALSAAKWTKIALVLLPLALLVVTITWIVRAH